jgi:hypothetical protein
MRLRRSLADANAICGSNHKADAPHAEVGREMSRFINLFPDFAPDFARRLREESYGALAEEAPGRHIARVSWDDAANAGSVTFHPVRETVGTSRGLGTDPVSIVEFDTEGDLLGIEFLSPPQAFADKLRSLAGRYPLEDDSWQ